MRTLAYPYKRKDKCLTMKNLSNCTACIEVSLKSYQEPEGSDCIDASHAFGRVIGKHLFVFSHEVTSLHHECKVAPEILGLPS